MHFFKKDTATQLCLSAYGITMLTLGIPPRTKKILLHIRVISLSLRSKFTNLVAVLFQHRHSPLKHLNYSNNRRLFLYHTTFGLSLSYVSEDIN